MPVHGSEVFSSSFEGVLTVHWHFWKCKNFTCSRKELKIGTYWFCFPNAIKKLALQSLTK